MIYSKINGKCLDKKVREIRNNYIDLSNIDEIMANERLDTLYSISTECDELDDELTGTDLSNIQQLEDQVLRLQNFEFYQES